MSNAEYTQWQAINERIKFFSDEFPRVFTSSPTPRENFYKKLVDFLSNELKNFEDKTKYPKIKDLLGSFFNENSISHIKNGNGTLIKNISQLSYRGMPELGGSDTTRDNIATIIFLLNNLASQISLVYFDKNILIKRQVELAFAHLQRILVANDKEKELWSSKKTEIDYEKLGAIHLLNHKIWAFKIDGKGERTDLVLGDTLAQDDMLYKSADGLVLTEWKLLKEKKVTEKDVKNKINEAKEQAYRYRIGSLLATELADYCYLVIVSKKSLESIIKKLYPLNEDYNFIENDVKYRIINLAYDRDPPSKE